MTTPDGVEWHVGRRWLTRRVQRSWSWRRNTAADALGSGGLPGGDWAAGGLEGVVLMLVGLLVVALVLVPVFLFGMELILVGCVLAGTLVGRVMLGRPWTIEARSVGLAGSERLLQWSVPGWRRSARVKDQVVEDLCAGREPEPTAMQPE